MSVETHRRCRSERGRMIDLEGLRAMRGRRMPKPEPPDTTTREGAEALARKLDAYWHAQGFPQVRHWAELQRNVTSKANRRSPRAFDRHLY